MRELAYGSRPPPSVVAVRREEIRLSNLSCGVTMIATLDYLPIAHRLGPFGGLLAANPAIALLLHFALLTIPVGSVGPGPGAPGAVAEGRERPNWPWEWTERRWHGRRREVPMTTDAATGCLMRWHLIGGAIRRCLV